MWNGAHRQPVVGTVFASTENLVTRATVKLRSGGELAAKMSQMRAWLDGYRFEPNVFRYEANTDGAVIRVAFKCEAEAAAFADAFQGIKEADVALVRGG